MFYKTHYNLVDICPRPCIQHANHISDRTDHPSKYCNKDPSQINANKYSFFPHRMNIWNRLPCSAVLHVTPSIDNCHKLSIPAIKVIQPLFVLLSLKFQMKGVLLFFISIVSNSILFTGYLLIFILIVVFMFSYFSIPG